MLRIAICDDEISNTFLIEQYMLDYSKNEDEEIETEVFITGKEFYEALIRGDCYDLVMLDVEMKGDNDIYIGSYIRDILHNESIQIAYMSRDKYYGQRLIEFRPLSFTEKPFDYFKVKKIIDKYKRLYGSSSDIYSFLSNHEKVWISISDIMYFESRGRKVNVVCVDGKEYEFYGTSQKIYEDLKPKGFFMIHKSYIVNDMYVQKVSSNETELKNGKKLPVSKHRKKEFLKWKLNRG